MFHKHKFGRKFYNKNSNVDWVARIIFDKLKNNTNMKLNEVVPYVRLRFATKIIGCMAFKARQLARKDVEGDSTKQYSLLWSYGAEMIFSTGLISNRRKLLTKLRLRTKPRLSI